MLSFSQMLSIDLTPELKDRFVQLKIVEIPPQILANLCSESV